MKILLLFIIAISFSSCQKSKSQQLKDSTHKTKCNFYEIEFNEELTVIDNLILNKQYLSAQRKVNLLRGSLEFIIYDVDISHFHNKLNNRKKIISANMK